MTPHFAIRTAASCLLALLFAGCSHIGPKLSDDPDNLRVMPKNVYSLESEVPAGLLIRNESKWKVAVYWIDYDGGRRPQTTVKAGETGSVGGFMGHAFVIEDDTPGPNKGKLLRIAYPDFPTGETIIRDKDFLDDVTHSTHEIHGWTVRIEKSMTTTEQRVIVDRITKLLAEVKEIAPADTVEFLQSIVIWFDKNAGADRGQYHPGYYWMEGSGWHLEKRRAIHFSRTTTLERALRTQPLVVLHELAHAYHDQILGFDDKRVIKAFENARTLKLYDKVKHVGGRTVRAYAMTDEKEYFAELTESYFGTNDFFPFNREELRKHDPAGYLMIKETWGIRGPK